MIDFPPVYIAFLILATLHRIKSLTSSYYHVEQGGKVYFRQSFPILLALYLIVFVGAPIEYFYLRRIVAIREVNLFISAIGFLMYIGIIPLRDHSVKALGRYMSQDIRILKDHKLIKEGPYRFMRHPLTLCIIIEAFGLSLVPNSYYTFLFVLIVFLPFNIFRIYVEERILIKKFGKEYIDYTKDVNAFLPLNLFRRGRVIE